MATYTQNALFGNTPNYSALDATMLNPNANGPDDWATVAANGLQAIVQGKINDMVRAEQQSALQDSGAIVLNASSNTLQMLLVAGLVYFIAKG